MNFWFYGLSLVYQYVFQGAVECDPVCAFSWIGRRAVFEDDVTWSRDPLNNDLDFRPFALYIILFFLDDVFFCGRPVEISCQLCRCTRSTPAPYVLLRHRPGLCVTRLWLPSNCTKCVETLDNKFHRTVYELMAPNTSELRSPLLCCCDPDSASLNSIYTFSMKIEAADFLEMLALVYQITRCDNPEYLPPFYNTVQN